MPIEIERKFLIIGNTWRDHVTRSRQMRQGYLSADEGRASVRVRIEGVEAHLNIKAAVVGTSRAEYDYLIPLAEGLEIFDTLCAGRVEKTRHVVEHQGHAWEIDEFKGDNAGLIVAEIELADAHEPFARPDWLGAEVTQEKRYYNHALSLHPYRQWAEAQGR